MSVDKFKFVSPGVFVDEIDNSQFPEIPDTIGPVVIGRSERGPGLRPVKVSSFSEFVEIFGNPVAGGKVGDVWREGNYNAPTYGAYAAQAWLKNKTPLTYVRLLGAQHDNAVTAGKAGWDTTTVTPSAVLADNGGAYGLFVGHVGAHNGTNITGSMALSAIFYLTDGGIKLGGPSHDAPGGQTYYNSARFIRSDGPDSGFTAVISDGTEDSVTTASFNFNRSSDKYIRKVFNTNPTLTNTAITQAGQADYGIDEGTSPNNSTKTYWLGETFDQYLADEVTGSAAVGDRIGIILAVDSDTAMWNGGDYKKKLAVPQSGWVIGQDITTDTGSYSPEAMPNLLKFHGLDVGEWAQKNIKVSFSEIDYSKNESTPYGTFTVEVRKANDNDTAKTVLERFDTCDLNPASPNYVGKKIGDTYQVWSEAERRYITYGNYLNNSKYLRVEVNPDIENGALSTEYLPFGFRGPAIFGDFTFTSQSNTLGGSWLKGSGSIPYTEDNVLFEDILGGYQSIGADAFATTFKFPRPVLAYSTSSVAADAVAQPPAANDKKYWGIETARTAGSTRFDESYYDVVRPRPQGVDAFTAAILNQTSGSVVFSLDDLSYKSGSTTLVYFASGSRSGSNGAAGAPGKSITAGLKYGTGSAATLSASYQNVLNAGFDSFTMPVFGGFDGLDITEREPFRNSQWSSPTEVTSYSYHSLKRAIDSVGDPEELNSQVNLMTIPGVTNTGITDYLINVCEGRGDALAIVDVEGGFIPNTENNKGDSHPDNRGSYSTVVTNMRTRSMNSSYGCTYYPWVQVKDTINGNLLWVPPSVIALGTMAFSEASSQLWFAPAGFTRGGLSNGAAGIPVINVREKLKQSHRDKLYEVNVNPIAHFPAEGIVVLGQRTLQATRSKLSSVNVRRLVIFVKKELSRLAATVLFDQNVEETWVRYRNEAVPFLNNIKAGLGLDEFRLVLDSSTTTPDLVDRNIVYAKVFLKPTGAIEFFALDVAIEGSGASFND